MKKLALIIALVSVLPWVFAQTESDDEYAGPQIWTRQGLVLEVQPNKFNFEEDWISIIPPDPKTHYQKVVVVTQNTVEGEYSTLVAPCLVEMSYIVLNGNPYPMEIKVLAQYQYDENGFIIKE
jgi:hypothetical protein